MKKVLCYTATASLLSQYLVFGDEFSYVEDGVKSFDQTSSYDWNAVTADTCQSSTTTPQPVSTSAPGTAEGSGSDSDFSSVGESYENKYASQYSKYYSSYWNGSNGASGYDGGNDGPNGAQRNQRIMCKCSKQSVGAKNENTAFSKCMNSMYGNNAQTWEARYSQYINNYKLNDNNSRSNKRNRKHHHHKNKNNDDNNNADAENAENTNEAVEPLETTETPQENEEYNNPNDVPLGGEDSEYETTGSVLNEFLPSNEYSNSGVLSGLNEDADDLDVNTGSFTHSDYMSYLATFLMFVGAILFVLVGYNCVKYTWKTYKLRNYEAIGENGIKTDELQSNKLKKHDRIRLPRKQPRKVETLDESNKMKYYDERATYTIGDV